MTEYTHVVSGLLRRRDELRTEAATLKDRQAVVANDVAAIERILESLGHTVPAALEARPARIILFYRNELSAFVKGELEKAGRPLTTRDLAMVLCDLEGKLPGDRRLLADVMRRINGSLTQMKAAGTVVSDGRRKNSFWQLALKSVYQGP